MVSFLCSSRGCSMINFGFAGIPCALTLVLSLSPAKSVHLFSYGLSWGTPLCATPEGN